MCGLCGDVEEDMIHVLQDCPCVVALWLPTVPTNKRAIFCRQFEGVIAFKFAEIYGME